MPSTAPTTAPAAQPAPEIAVRPPPPPDGLPAARVTRVVDGDTIDVDPGGRVRLIGIDTPEAVDPRRPVECFAKEASAAMGGLVANRTVLLELDPTQGERDTFGRLLRFVWLPSESAATQTPQGARPTLVNFELIARGYAHEFTYNTSYKYRDLFKQAQAHAQRYKLGLWAPETCAGFTARPAPTPRPTR
ncbi:MAG TPA: thermonuclease family protein [Chloroflexota bacterium]|nr:thermonuclease family protein [Chloroflexota bacterium]